MRDAKKIAKNRHLGTIAQLCRAVSSQVRHVTTIGKKLLNSNISSRRPHNMVRFGPLTAEIGLPVWGIPTNFNRFRVLASLLQRRRLPEANQTLHDLWPSPGLVHYIYIFGGFSPWRNFTTCKIHFASMQVLRSSMLAALLHGTPAAGVSHTCGVEQGMELRNFRRERHLYLAGRPSRWASPHILVVPVFEFFRGSCQSTVPFCPAHCYHYCFTHVFIEQINDDDDDDYDMCVFLASLVGPVYVFVCCQLLFLWPPCVVRSRCGHYILQLWLLFSSFLVFPRLIEAVADWRMSTIHLRMVWP